MATKKIPSTKKAKSKGRSTLRAARELFSDVRAGVKKNAKKQSTKKRTAKKRSTRSR